MRDPDANEANKGKARRKSFFAMALNLVQVWFITAGFPVGLILPSLELSDTLRPLTPLYENAFPYYPVLGRSFGHDYSCQCPCQYHLPCIEGPECFQKPNFVLRSVHSSHGFSRLGLIQYRLFRWIQQCRNTCAVPPGQWLRPV